MHQDQTGTTKIARAKVQEKVQWEGQARSNHPEEEPARRNLVVSTAKGCMCLERQRFEHSELSITLYIYICVCVLIVILST